MAEAVKVAIRARPISQRELSAGATLALAIHDKSLSVGGKTFTYDNIYWAEEGTENYATQEQVIEGTGDAIVEQALNGFNGCMFAYGQTGGGKSYSIFGNKENPGYIPWTVDQIFQQKAEMEGDPMKELRIWVSYMEIYNEHLHDLLHHEVHKRDKEDNLKVHEHPKLGVYVPGLNEEPVESQQQVMKLLDYGAKKRAVAATQMNATSSRSHAVFTIKLQILTGARPKKPDKARTHCKDCGNINMDDAAFCRKCGKTRLEDGRQEMHAKINLIDLAGSERQSRAQAEGEQLREACAINKSLSALGLVIKELSAEQAQEETDVPPKPVVRQRAKTLGDLTPTITRNLSMLSKSSVETTMSNRPVSVPFRASKLTFLLKDSLAGNSKTHMLAAISPASDSIDETISTLRFASSVKSIKTVAVQNRQTRNNIVKGLQGELELLTAKLATMEDASRQPNDHEMAQVADLERLLAEQQQGYEAQLLRANELHKTRVTALEEMALTQEEISSLLGFDPMTPYLLNMCDDAMLAGKLLFYVWAGQTRRIGSATENDICLCGIGIPEELCVLENVDNSSLTIRKCGPEGRIVVAGQPLEGDLVQELHHAQRLYLGRAFAFKVAIPIELQSISQEPVVAPSTRPTRSFTEDSELLLEGFEDEGAAIEHSRSWNSLSEYLSYVAKQMPSDQATALWNEVKKAVHICDEANDITAECRPEEGIQFEVDLTSALRMSVVVRVLRIPHEGSEDSQQLYIWSVGQMIERLDRMRDCYHAYIKTDTFDVDPLQDPWHETQAATIWKRITDLENGYMAMAEENMRLKTHKAGLLAKTALIWQGPTKEHMAKLILHSWYSLIKSKRHEEESNPPSPTASPQTQKRRTVFEADELLAKSYSSAKIDLPDASSATRPAPKSRKGSQEGREGGSPLSEQNGPSLEENVDPTPERQPYPYPDMAGVNGAAVLDAASASSGASPVAAAAAGAVSGSQGASPGPTGEMRQAFEQLRSEISEQQEEAKRLKNNRRQIYEALDRFEKLLTGMPVPVAEAAGQPGIGSYPGWADNSVSTTSAVASVALPAFQQSVVREVIVPGYMPNPAQFSGSVPAPAGLPQMVSRQPEFFSQPRSPMTTMRTVLARPRSPSPGPSPAQAARWPMQSTPSLASAYAASAISSGSLTLQQAEQIGSSPGGSLSLPAARMLPPQSALSMQAIASFNAPQSLTPRSSAPIRNGMKPGVTLAPATNAKPWTGTSGHPSGFASR